MFLGMNAGGTEYPPPPHYESGQDPRAPDTVEDLSRASGPPKAPLGQGIEDGTTAPEGVTLIATRPEAGGRRRRRGSRSLHPAYTTVLLGMATVWMVNGFSRFVYTLILNEMRDSFRLTFAQAGALSTANLLGYMIGSIIGGQMVTRVGLSRLVGGSLLVMGVATMSTGLAPGYGTAWLLRLIAGVAGAMAMVPMLASTSRWFHHRYRGAAAGLMVGGSGIGIVLAGLVAPLLLSAYGAGGWRAVWVFLGAGGVLLGVVAGRLLIDAPEDAGLLAIGSPGQTSLGEEGVAGRPGARRAAILLGLIYGLWGAAYLVFTTFFAAHLAEQTMLSDVTIGRLWMLVGVVSTVSGVVWGALSDRLDRGAVISTVLVVQALSYLVFGYSASLPGALVSCILFGITAWSIPGLITAGCGDYAGEASAPSVLGVLMVYLGVGQMIGPWAGGYVRDLTDSFTAALIMALAFSLLGATLALFLPRLSRSVATVSTEKPR